MARQRNVYNQAQRSNSSGLGGVYATFMEYPRAEVIASDIPQLLALKAKANAPEEVDGASISELNSFIKNQEFEPVGSDIPTNAQMQWNQEINKLNADSATHKNITLSKNVNTPLNSLAQSLDNDNYYGMIQGFANNNSKIKANEAKLKNIWAPYRDAIQDEAYSKDIAWDGYQPIRTGDIAIRYGIDDNGKNSIYLNSQLYSFQDNNYDVFKHNPNIIQRPVKLDYDKYNSLLTQTFQNVKPDQLTFVYDAMSKASVEDVRGGQATTSSDKQKITTGVSLEAINALHAIINSDEDEAVKNQEIARILQIGSEEVSNHMAAIKAVTLFEETIQNTPELRSVHLRQIFGFYDNVFRNGKYKNPNDPTTEIEIDEWFLENVLPEDLMYGTVNYEDVDNTDEKARLIKLEKQYKDDIESTLQSTYTRRMRAYNPSSMTYEFNDLIDVRPATDSEIVSNFLTRIFTDDSIKFDNTMFSLSSIQEFALSGVANTNTIKLLHEMIPETNDQYFTAKKETRKEYVNMNPAYQIMINEVIDELRPYLELQNPDRRQLSPGEMHDEILKTPYPTMSKYDQIYMDLLDSKLLMETVNIESLSDKIIETASTKPKDFKGWTNYDILREMPHVVTRKIWLSNFEKGKQNVDGYEVYKVPTAVYMRKDDQYYVYKKQDFKRIEESFNETGRIDIPAMWIKPPPEVKNAIQFEGSKINRNAVIMFAGSQIEVPGINFQSEPNAGNTNYGELEAVSPIYPFMVNGELKHSIGFKTTIVIDESNFKALEGLPVYDKINSTVQSKNGKDVYTDEEYLTEAGIVKRKISKDDERIVYEIPVVVSANLLHSALVVEGKAGLLLGEMTERIKSSRPTQNNTVILNQ